MKTVFLSYSRKDGNDFVAEIQRQLEARGYTIWRDIRNLRPDQDFTADIEAGIENTACVVVCVTEDTKRNNSFVRREIQYALALKKPVIPLRCHNTFPHISIINNEWVDYFADKARAIERLCEILSDPRLQNQPGNQAEDPVRPYLESALKSIVSGLRQRIIRQIDLRSQATPDAVSTFPTPPTHADIFELAMSGVTLSEREAAAQPEEKRVFDTFTEAFDYYSGRVLLMGEPGAGKTITLMAYARDAYAARLEDPTQPLPLFGLVSTWNPDEQQPLAEWLAETHQLETEIVRQAIEQGKALLLLDGLDELGWKRGQTDWAIDASVLQKRITESDRNRESYDPRIQFIQALPYNNQILITSRTEDYQDLVEQGEKAALRGAITLQPLDESQMAEYLADQPELWQVIQEDEQLRAITKTPLLMSFFAFAYHSMDAAERSQLIGLQSSRELRDRIFLAYVEQSYRHEASKIQASLPLSYNTMLHLLGELAMRNAGAWTSPLDMTNVLKPGQLKEVLSEDVIEDFISLTTHLNILSAAERGSYRFIHLLLRDALAYFHARQELQSPNTESRRRAAVALAEVGDAAVVDALIAALHDEDWSVRGSAATALAQIGDERTKEPFITALNDGHWAVRGKVVVGLGEMGDDRAVEALITALRDKNWLVRYLAVDALQRAGTPEAMAAVEEWRKAKHWWQFWKKGK